jgi:AcrR family transcriptional regulator
MGHAPFVKALLAIFFTIRYNRAVPTASISRDEVVARIQAVFRDYGFDGASLREISNATGLGKGSLYHYFPGGKDDMAVAVLERVDGWMRERVLEPLRGTGTPQARLRTVVRALDELYDGGRNACVLGSLVVGAGGTRLQKPLGNAFAGWIDALRLLAIEAGVKPSEARRRAEDAVVRIEGSLVVAAALADGAPFKRALRAIERELLSHE